MNVRSLLDDIKDLRQAVCAELSGCSFPTCIAYTFSHDITPDTFDGIS